MAIPTPSATVPQDLTWAPHHRLLGAALPCGQARDTMGLPHQTADTANAQRITPDQGVFL